ncbi:hypothetical protein ACHAW6_002051, partial [Cyclotella cf. meneghiniana]
MNYVFALAIVVAPKSTFGERNFLPSGNRVRSNVRGIAKNSRPVVHKKSDAPPRRRSLRANRRDLRNDRLLDNFSMSLHDESTTSPLSTDFTSSEASMSLLTVISSTLPARTDSAVSMSMPEAAQLASIIATTFSTPVLDKDFENVGEILELVASMSMNVPHYTTFFSLSMLSSEESFSEHMETVNSVTSLSLPEFSGDSYVSNMLLRSTDAPINVPIPFSMSLLEESFEEYKSMGEYIYSMRMSIPPESTYAYLSMPSLDEHIAGYSETVDSVASMSMLQAKIDLSLSIPLLPSTEAHVEVSSPFSMPIVEEDFWGNELSSEYIDSTNMSSPGEGTYASLSMLLLEEDFSDYIETVNALTSMSMSMSMSMPKENHGVSFSMPLLPSGEAPFEVSTPYSMPVVEEDSEGYRIDEDFFASISMPLPGGTLFFSLSMPSLEEDFSDYTETVEHVTRMSLPDLSFSISLSDKATIYDVPPLSYVSTEEDDFKHYHVAVETSMPEKSFISLFFQTEQDIEESSMSMPSDDYVSMSVLMDEPFFHIPAEEEFSGLSMTIAVSLSTSMQEHDFDGFEITPTEEDGMDGIRDWCMVEVERSMSLSLSTSGDIMPIVVSLSMSTQEQGFDEFEIPPDEDDTDFSGFSMPVETSYGFSLPEDGMDGIGDGWWTDFFSMAEVDRSMSLSLSTTSNIMPMYISLSMSTQEQGFDEFETSPEDYTDFSGYSLPVEASFSFSIPEDGMGGAGDWWWTDFSMAEVDRSVSLSLSTTGDFMPIYVSLSMSTQEHGFDEFEIPPDEDYTDFSGFSLPDKASYGVSLPEDGMDGIGDG